MIVWLPWRLQCRRIAFSNDAYGTPKKKTEEKEKELV